MTVLEELLERCRDRRGIEYMAAKAALKRYLDELTETQFYFDIGRVKDKSLFGHLISAGLSRSRQVLLADLTKEAK